MPRLRVAVLAKDSAIACALRLDAQHHKNAEFVILSSTMYQEPVGFNAVWLQIRG